MSIEVKNLSFSYGKRPVLRDISFRGEYGQFLSVLGPNGVGKSTLFRCMLGLLRPSSGECYVDGEAISSIKAPRLAGKLAYIPQSHAPIFQYSVFDMVLMGTTAQTGSFSAPGKEQEAKACAALDRLGIGHLKDRSYAALSGGERQLVLIARALAQEAKILLMDEPSSALDFGNRLRVMETLRSLNREGYCVIQSTHDPEQAYLYSHSILALKDGKVLAHGEPRNIFDSKLISRLYDVEVEVYPLKNDKMRVCIAKGDI